MNNKKFRPRLIFSVLGLGEIPSRTTGSRTPVYQRSLCEMCGEKRGCGKYSPRSNSLAFVIPLMLHGHSCAIEGIIIDPLAVVIPRDVLHPKNVKNHF